MKKFSVQLVAVLVAVGMVLGVGLADPYEDPTQEVSTVITAKNELHLASAPISLVIGTESLEFILEYTTNDGTEYDIQVVAENLGKDGGWDFDPYVTGNVATDYPELEITVVGETSVTKVLIDSTNVSTEQILDSIQNEAGELSLTLLATGNIVELVAGTYSTTLIYTLE